MEKNRGIVTSSWKNKMGKKLFNFWSSLSCFVAQNSAFCAPSSPAYWKLTPDYTHQGDLNLIIKLGDFETNPLRSDTVDWREKMDLHSRHVGNDAVLKGSFKPYLTTNAAAPLFLKILEENECKSVCRSHLDVERGSQLLHTLRLGA